jgi:hypothetical protein
MINDQQKSAHIHLGEVNMFIHGFHQIYKFAENKVHPDTMIDFTWPNISYIFSLENIAFYIIHRRKF